MFLFAFKQKNLSEQDQIVHRYSFELLNVMVISVADAASVI